MEKENMETGKNTKGLIRKAIDEEHQKLLSSTDKDKRIEHLFNILILKTCLITLDEIDGGELEKLIRGFEKLKGDVGLAKSQEIIDDIVGKYREDFVGSGRC